MRYISRLFAHDILQCNWCPTCYEVKIIAQGCHSNKNASQDSELMIDLTGSICCHQRQRKTLINTTCFSRLFAVSVESNRLQCENNSVRMSFEGKC